MAEDGVLIVRATAIAKLVPKIFRRREAQARAKRERNSAKPEAVRAASRNPMMIPLLV
jgi:hypothetical protein